MHCNSTANSNEAKTFSAQASATGTADAVPLHVIKQWYAGHGGPAAYAADNWPRDEYEDWSIDNPMQCSSKTRLPMDEIKRQMRHCFIFMLNHNSAGPYATVNICKATISKTALYQHWTKFRKAYPTSSVHAVDQYLATLRAYGGQRKS